jgi:hypothetical protein
MGKKEKRHHILEYRHLLELLAVIVIKKGISNKKKKLQEKNSTKKLLKIPNTCNKILYQLKDRIKKEKLALLNS